jgi:quinolinate synthase
MTDKEARDIIAKVKQALVNRLVILGHHYQSDEIIAYADYVGDSLELAQQASRIEAAEYIVLCGVYFMAETAAILAPGKSVFIPDRDAGCPLADMAGINHVNAAWDRITLINKESIPITYVNSSAELKAFCGRNGGTVCTSANAKKVVAWALNRGSKVFFMPDMNLGRNTAEGMNIPGDEIVLWDPSLADGGLKDDDIRKSRIILWRGWCPVHCPVFTVEDVQKARAQYQGTTVMVHPETDPATVRAAGSSGSTSQILAHIENTPEGGRLAIGTETHMVQRAAQKNAGRVTVIPLREIYCEDMAKITLPKLAVTLTGVTKGTGKVVLGESVLADARKALDIMLKI